MISRYTYHGGAWIDLELPTQDEIRRIAAEYGISERLEAELFSPTQTSLVASDEGATFLVLHFPTSGTADGDIHDQEIDFLIGDGFIITIRYEVVASLHRLRKVLEAEQLIAPEDSMTTDVLLEIIFTHLYTNVRDHITSIANRLTHIEHDMFNGLEKDTVRAISNTSREFLHIEAALANQEESLHRFLKACTARGLFGVSFEERAERMRAERTQVARLSTTYRAISTELRETNASLLEASQNEIMKTLTVINFGVLPLELIALIFGMHELGTPLQQNPNAFWIILALMIATTGLMTFFFARRRWLS